MRNFILSSRGLTIIAFATLAGAASAQYFQSDDFMPSPHYRGSDLISYQGSALQMLSIDVDVNMGRVKAPTSGGTITTLVSGHGTLTLGGDQPTQGQFGTLIDSMISIHDNGSGVYSMEMLQMDIHGGTLPQGTMIRESPTLQSLGQTTITPTNGAFRINSFFDVFTELSIDGGQTWMPSSSAVHLTGTPEPASVLAIFAGLSGLALRRRKS